jgi:hypothetical protein
MQIDPRPSDAGESSSSTQSSACSGRSSSGSVSGSHAAFVYKKFRTLCSFLAAAA